MTLGSDLITRAARVPARAALELHFAGVLKEAGLLGVERPSHILASINDVRHWGQLGASVSIAARRYGDATALVDERGELTFKELDERANRLCNTWREQGLKAGDGVALLARNHRGFLDATFAACKAGARLILLNTDFAGPQIREVAEREDTALLVHDDEYSSFLQDVTPRLGRVRAWTDEPGEDTLEAQIASGDPSAPPAPASEAKLIVLTSGTTGTPKGAPRQQPKSLQPMGALLSKAPFKAREVTIVAAPLFHALGFVHGVIAVGLGSKLILRRRFDPEAAVQAIAEHGVTAIIVVPIMLRRMLELGGETLAKYDTSSLRIIFVAGSQLGGELCSRALKQFGPVVYNLYGSTEVAYATIATPDELTVAPDSVGTPPRGAVVQLYDTEGNRLHGANVTGRIFVGNGFQFEGYTGGGTKDVIDGLMSSGDVGHFDENGLLFIDGRDDDMIVSGGENVFPAEIEELLQGHPDIIEAAVIGVPDEKFGHRLRAYVVVADGVELTEDQVRSHVRDNLARYKVPRDVVFLEVLPRNPTGKVIKRELGDLEAAS